MNWSVRGSYRIFSMRLLFRRLWSYRECCFASRWNWSTLCDTRRLPFHFEQRNRKTNRLSQLSNLLQWNSSGKMCSQLYQTSPRVVSGMDLAPMLISCYLLVSSFTQVGCRILWSCRRQINREEVLLMLAKRVHWSRTRRDGTTQRGRQYLQKWYCLQENRVRPW